MADYSEQPSVDKVAVYDPRMVLGPPKWVVLGVDTREPGSLIPTYRSSCKNTHNNVIY